MRYRVKGSTVTPTGSAIAFEEPANAIMEKQGGRSSLITPGDLFPKEYTPAAMCEVRTRIKAWRINLSFTALGDGGVWPAEDGDVEAIVAWNRADEQELWEMSTSQLLVTSVAGTLNGVSWEGGIGGMNVCSRSGDFTPYDAPITFDYYYNPTSNVFLPRVEIDFTGPGNSYTRVRNYHTDPTEYNTALFTEVNKGMTFHGTATDCYVIQRDASPIDMWDLTIVPHEWWEYRDSNGLNPIWDANTGAQLMDYRTLLD